MGSASWSPLLSPPPHPPPSPSPLPQPGSLSGASPMLFRPTCGQGSHAEVWTPAPPPASLLASPRSLFRSPESRSSCLADRNPCPRGAWGWRARDRQQTGSTSRGVAGDEHWRTQLRGGAGREHGKRPHSGAALTGRRQPKEAGPGGASCGARFFLYPSSPRRASHTALGRLESRSTGEQGRGSQPALDYPRALRSPRLGAHRLRGCLECGACAPMRQPQS